MGGRGLVEAGLPLSVAIVPIMSPVFLLLRICVGSDCATRQIADTAAYCCSTRRRCR
jgi:hypothetical protein